MNRRSLTALVVAVGATSFGAKTEAATKLLAVLPLNVEHAKEEMNASAQASIEEMLRDVASTVLSPAGWTILTGETTLQHLEDNGLDAEKVCEASCALQAGRELKANMIVTGSVQFSDGEFTASIRLIEVASERTLASERLTGTTAKTLREHFEGKARAFFERGGLVSATVLKVTGTPPDSSLTVAGPNGFATTAAVPWEGRGLDAGTYKLTLTHDGFQTGDRDADVELGHTIAANIDLQRIVTEEERARAIHLGVGIPLLGLTCGSVVLAIVGYGQANAAHSSLLAQSVPVDQALRQQLVSQGNTGNAMGVSGVVGSIVTAIAGITMIATGRY